jgi:sugar phosphate isomerase/epimerase
MFSFWHGYDHEEVVYENLRKMVAIASEYGVYMHHENEKDIFGDTAERVLKIMENVQGLKYIYDPANFLQCDEPADKTLDLFHAKTDYFHIKDVIVETGALVPAGYGDGKIKELLERITDDKVLTLEPHLAVFDAYKSIDNTEMKHKFTYASANEAFDAAVTAIKALLNEVGYKEVNGVFVK